MQRVSLAFHELRGKGFPARAAEIKLDDFKFLFRMPRFTKSFELQYGQWSARRSSAWGVVAGFSTSRPDGVSISRVSQILGVSPLSVIRFSLFFLKIFAKMGGYKIHN